MQCHSRVDAQKDKMQNYTVTKIEQNHTKIASGETNETQRKNDEPSKLLYWKITNVEFVIKHT